MREAEELLVVVVGEVRSSEEQPQKRKEQAAQAPAPPGAASAVIPAFAESLYSTDLEPIPAILLHIFDTITRFSFIA